jgi:hypothetical protein
MKTLLLFLLLPVAGMGQQDAKCKNTLNSDSVLTYSSSGTLASLYAIPDPILTDTIPVVMLVSDTTSIDQDYWTSLGNGLIQKKTISVISSQVWQKEGYEVMVRKEYEYGGVFFDNDTGLWSTWHWVHSCYLDHNKKPLNLCVWDCKRRGE